MVGIEPSFSLYSTGVPFSRLQYVFDTVLNLPIFFAASKSSCGVKSFQVFLDSLPSML